MIYTHNLNPVLFDLGALQVRYYGIFVVIAILLGIGIWKWLLKDDKKKYDTLFDLLVWLLIGGVVGARLGHVFFYEWEYYSQDLTQIFFIQNGGLASHGLTIGLVIAFFVFMKVKKLKIIDYLDLAILPLPLIVIFVRLANFINGEIVGRPTGGEWGVLFPGYEVNPIPRHPTQLYEAALGVMILGLTVLAYKNFNIKRGKPFYAFTTFLGTYFATRFLVEFLKEYQTLDPSNALTMGQYLSIIPVLVAVYLVWYLYKRDTQQTKKPKA